MSDSTLSSWLLVLWRALESHRLAPQDLFRQAGLDPARLRDPNASLSLCECSAAVATRHRGASGDPLAASVCASPSLCHPTTFHALRLCGWQAQPCARPCSGSSATKG
ncbi:MAG: hypothetical protein MZV65_13175 [Chromatiales bacterium]|nr:hypothetical protein [Chromatiales bacterium]